MFLTVWLDRFTKNPTMPDGRGESGHILMQRANSVNFIPVLEEFCGMRHPAQGAGGARSEFQPCSRHPFLQ